MFRKVSYGQIKEIDKRRYVKMAENYGYRDDKECREYETVFAEEKQGATAPKTKTKKAGKLVTRTCSALMCGLLFGSSTAVAFYGVNGYLNDKAGGTESTFSIAGVAESLLNKAEAGTQAQGSLLDASDSARMLSMVSFDAGTEQLSQNLDVSDIAEGMMPAMVSITNISVQEVQSYFGMFGRGQMHTQELQSSGTGIIIGENESELLIVTNNHVVEDATTLSVCFVDDEVCEAAVKGTDPDNDLAVIAVKLSEIKSETIGAIKVAKIGDSDALKVGEQVVAIGNALGYGQSVTTGIVSALNRQIDTTDAIMIQTDAAINPGNSGGALLNMDGEVIGINSAKFSSTEVEGMGYAISITTATPIIEKLMNRTTREKVDSEDAAYLGINGEDITSQISSVYGIPQGIYVTYVGNDSPAQAAGITAKSVITHFDGIRVTTLSELQKKLQYYAAGETVEITLQVLEGNEYVEKVVEITLGSAADYQKGGNQNNGSQGHGNWNNGNQNYGNQGGYWGR